MSSTIHNSSFTERPTASHPHTSGHPTRALGDDHECPYCGADVFSQFSEVISGLKQHSHRATMVDTYWCEECDWEYQSYSNGVARVGADLEGHKTDLGFREFIPENTALFVRKDDSGVRTEWSIIKRIEDATKDMTEEDADLLAEDDVELFMESFDGVGRTEARLPFHTE